MSPCEFTVCVRCTYRYKFLLNCDNVRNVSEHFLKNRSLNNFPKRTIHQNFPKSKKSFRNVTTKVKKLKYIGKGEGFLMHVI